MLSNKSCIGNPRVRFATVLMLQLIHRVSAAAIVLTVGWLADGFLKQT